MEKSSHTITHNTLTGNGAADLAPPRANTGTVPDHAVLGSLIGFSHSVVLLVDFIIAPFLWEINGGVFYWEINMSHKE